MNAYLHTLTSILVIACVILLVVMLRKRGVLHQENGILFSQLVIQVTLPALIFDALSRSTFEWQYILLFLYMFISEMILLVIAWIFGKILQLERSQMGSFLLASAFGSSALLGYPLIMELFPGNVTALTEGTFVSEFGVGLPLFTVGVMVAIHYGQEQQTKRALFSSAFLFFKSPIFIAIVTGLLWSFSPLGTTGIFLTPLFEALHIIAKANTFLVALTVGVLLSFSSLHSIMWLALVTIVIKLIISPLLVYLPASMMSLEPWQLQVLLLEAAMPSAMLSVVLAKRYGCDAKLAAKLVFITLTGSLFTVSFMIGL
ncbi:AEC family transporter [Sulfurovum sp. NBC37-1]|uniref:AEC family transporter n=1 Tax=Sulfurovum sp. (strain NBC37-1) TaxID=387093 RepID=UPI0001587633|nr:AEC family transporter [Sulfurovum sp. NBC37-1]BAF71854.1 auxin efflux carrier [Sulfurovum sp. NBC37-1]